MYFLLFIQLLDKFLTILQDLKPSNMLGIYYEYFFIFIDKKCYLVERDSWTIKLCGNYLYKIEFC